MPYRTEDFLRALLADNNFWDRCPQEKWSEIIHNLRRTDLPGEDTIAVTAAVALIMLEVMKEGWSADALADQMPKMIREAQLWLSEDE